MVGRGGSALLPVLSLPPDAHASSRLASLSPVLYTAVCIGHIGKVLALGTPPINQGGLSQGKQGGAKMSVLSRSSRPDASCM